MFGGKTPAMDPNGYPTSFMNIRKFFCLRNVVIAALFFCLGSARAASTNYDGPRWAFLDTKKILEAATAITTAKYPDSDSATVEKKMVRVYRADGTGECQDE